MKNKHKRAFYQSFPWWDQSFLLEAIELWCLNASRQHKNKGNLLRHNETAHKLKVLGLLAKRLKDYQTGNHKLFSPVLHIETEFRKIPDKKGYSEVIINKHPDKVTYDRYYKYNKLREDRAYKEAKEFFFDYFKKNLEVLWD